MDRTQHEPWMRTAFAGNNGSRSRRIVLYSHDTKGLGHLRRNLLLAQVLSSSRLSATCLLIAGTRAAGLFLMPPGVDCVALPAYHKERDGEYRARDLNIPLEDLINLRAQSIRSTVEAFEPDVLIVDYSPRGGLHELDATLEYLQAKGHTRCVLGLRDVLSDPAYLQREWSRTESVEAILDFYDAVWVYGDRNVYDAVRHYGFPGGVAAKTAYTGYLDQRVRLRLLQEQSLESWGIGPLPSGGLVVCLVGGGQDGTRLAEAFVAAEFPDRTHGVIVTGPFMPFEARRQLHEQAAGRRDLRVIECVPEPGLLLQKADRVIAMGGYNTVCEVLSFEKPALVVPRANPRREQIIRAERLSDLGIIDMLSPDDLDSRALTRWLAQERPAPRVHGRIDMNGLDRVPEFLEQLLPAPTPPVILPIVGGTERVAQ